MIILHTFGPAFGLPDPSPFVIKAEMLLKFAGLAYECRSTSPWQLRRAPKGKLPYLRDDDAVIADSTFIRWHIEKKYAFDFDRGLSVADRAVAWAVEKMLEDHLYWAMVCERWLNDENFNRGPAVFFQKLPGLLRPAVQRFARAGVRNMCKAHGMGRHNSEEIAMLAAKDIDSIAHIMGEKPYLMGTMPCGTDATVFAFLLGIACPRFESKTRQHLERHTHLQAYTERLLAQYFPELGAGRAGQ